MRAPHAPSVRRPSAPEPFEFLLLGKLAGPQDYYTSPTRPAGRFLFEGSGYPDQTAVALFTRPLPPKDPGRLLAACHGRRFAAGLRAFAGLLRASGWRAFGV